MSNIKHRSNERPAYVTAGQAARAVMALIEKPKTTSPDGNTKRAIETTMPKLNKY